MARNTGASEANGEILVFIDDDCEPDKNWLRAFEHDLMKDSNRLLGGRTINILKNNPYSSASHELIEYLYSYYNINPDDAKFIASNNMAMSARIFRDIGGFDIKLTRAAAEDRELCDRLRFFGYNLNYAPQAIVFHSHKLTFYKFWIQHFNYGRGAYYFRIARVMRGQDPIKVEPLSFYMNLLRYPMTKNTSHHYSYISFLLVISQLANISGFVWEYFNQNIKGS